MSGEQAVLNDPLGVLGGGGAAASMDADARAPGSPPPTARPLDAATPPPSTPVAPATPAACANTPLSTPTQASAAPTPAEPPSGSPSDRLADVLDIDRRVSLDVDSVAATPPPPAALAPPSSARPARPSTGSRPRTPLLEGERVLMHEPLAVDVSEVEAPIDGALFVTAYRVLFEPLDGGAAARSVAVGSVSKLRRAHVSQGRVREDGERVLEYVVDVVCRLNARAAMRLQVTGALAHRLHAQLASLHQRCTVGESFACAHGGGARAAAADGWRVYDHAAEMHRQGLLNPLSCWRLTEANREYQLCASYPPWLVVPKAVSDDAVRASAAFRASRRFPVLSWKDPQSFASVSRAGQPLVGLNGKRCREDEALLAALLDTNPEAEVLAIVDCRPRLNAEANALGGKGYEHAQNYARTSLVFVDIQNIHVMRDSMRRLLVALEGRAESASDWLRELNGCGWLEHVQAVLKGAQLVAQQVTEHRSVLVHCSDGWDRTSQLTSLAQMLLDPHFRTLRGFAILVEKEWLAFGHQFALRTGSPVVYAPAADSTAPGAGTAGGGAPTGGGGGGSGSGSAAAAGGSHGSAEEQQSPVFVQFVDAVWQLTGLLPRAFEFNQRFLCTVLEHLLSGRFGTFLLNSHGARAASGLPQRTGALWAELLDRPAERGLTNPWYAPEPGPLKADLSGCRLQVFTPFYCRGAHTVDPNDARGRAEDAVHELRRQLARHGAAPPPPLAA